jgi:hypothetical protein
MTEEDNDLNDPEDAYDASDPPKERLLNFARRLNWLIDRDETFRERLERLRDDIDRLRSEMTD